MNSRDVSLELRGLFDRLQSVQSTIESIRHNHGIDSELRQAYDRAGQEYVHKFDEWIGIMNREPHIEKQPTLSLSNDP